MKKIFLLVALGTTLVPAIFVIYKAGGLSSWQGVLPPGTTDSRYYYARIHEVLDGHLFIGNPYVYERRGDYSPAFFLPDAVSALPMLLGLPFNAGVVLNMFVWSFVFLLLSFTLFLTALIMIGDLVTSEIFARTVRQKKNCLACHSRRLDILCLYLSFLHSYIKLGFCILPVSIYS